MPRNDPLGDRMKGRYETRARTYLPRRTYTAIRLDGNAFHTYTRGLDKPFDLQLMEDMAATTMFLCEQIPGVRYAYTQSDEISLLVTDFARPSTEAWFDGNVQKIVSISAAMATAEFNRLRPGRLAFFDSRVFTIPDPVEVENYFVWRQQDAMRNAVSMAAQAHFSHKALHGKSSDQMQEMLWQDAGVNFNDYPPRCKRGTGCFSVLVEDSVSYVDKRSGETLTAEGVLRRVWKAEAPPIFTRNPKYLKGVIPVYGRDEGL